MGDGDPMRRPTRAAERRGLGSLYSRTQLPELRTEKSDSRLRELSVLITTGHKQGSVICCACL